MKKMIDCFIIRHNEPDFEDCDKTIKKMGISAGTPGNIRKNVSLKIYSLGEEIKNEEDKRL